MISDAFRQSRSVEQWAKARLWGTLMRFKLNLRFLSESSLLKSSGEDDEVQKFWNLWIRIHEFDKLPDKVLEQFTMQTVDTKDSYADLSGCTKTALRTVLEWLFESSSYTDRLTVHLTGVTLRMTLANRVRRGAHECRRIAPDELLSSDNYSSDGYSMKTN